MADDLFDVEQVGGPVGEGKGGASEAIVLRLYVHPGAGRPAVVGTRGDALYVRVAPPPADGRANAAVIELVSDLFDVPKSEVEIVGGEHNRSKRARVSGVGADRARRVLEAAVTDAEAAPGRPGGKGARRRG